jgi:1-acyl-sn-glycerol-3-phosphate acyltransferase
MKQNPNPILYSIAQKIIRWGIGIFFKSIDIRHKENIPKEGPVLFVVNHPSSQMDAFVMLSLTKRKIHYIAHAGLFANKLTAWLLSSFGVIPVYQKKGRTQEKESNIEAFEACYDALEKGGAICIFPEGISNISSHIKKLKTGAARIVLGAEKRNNYSLGIKIIPIGLYFRSRSRFHSTVTINVGRPIDLQPFFPLNEKDNTEAVHQLTAQIQNALEHLTVNIKHAELEPFIKEVEKIYRDDLMSESPAKKEPETQATLKYMSTRMIAECIEYYQEKDPKRVAAWQEKLITYKRKLKRLHIKDNMLKEKSTFAQSIQENLKSIALLIIAFPAAAYGIFNNWIPYFISERLAKRFVKERAKILLVLFLGGGITFIVFYSLQTFVIWSLVGKLWAVIYLFSLPITGFFALKYIRRFRILREQIQFSLSIFTKRYLIGKMRYSRKKLIQEMDEIKEEYLTCIGSQVEDKAEP